MRRFPTLAFMLSLACLPIADATWSAAHGQEGAPGDDGAANEETKPEEPQERASDGPFSDSMRRLATIFGSMHFLRTLCGEEDPSVWRADMESLLEAQAPSDPDRRRLIASFNNGYRSYESTYRDCTPAARVAYNRYQSEGLALSRDILNRYGN